MNSKSLLQASVVAIVLWIALLLLYFFNAQAKSTVGSQPIMISHPSALSTMTTWAKTYGGSGTDRAYSILPTPDGGYIFSGLTNSFGISTGAIWIVKLNMAGNIVWQKAYLDGIWDTRVSLTRAHDGGYIIFTSTGSVFFANVRWLVLKIDDQGNVLWQKVLGEDGPEFDSPSAITPTDDGGYAVTGSALPSGASFRQARVIKLDGDGNIVWQKLYSGNNNIDAYSIISTTDAGYAVAGVGDPYAWVMKLDSGGNVTWQRAYGDQANYFAETIRQTRDNGYIVAGRSSSTGINAWVAKLDSTGALEWHKTYGMNADEWISSIYPTDDGGYIAVGNWNFNPPTQGDVWVLKLDGIGNVLWQKTYGSNSFDTGESIYSLGDGGYIVAGWSFGFGNISEALVLKLDANGEIGDSCPLSNSPTITITTPANNITNTMIIQTVVTTTLLTTPTIPSVESTPGEIATHCAYFNLRFPFLSTAP